MFTARNQSSVRNLEFMGRVGKGVLVCPFPDLFPELQETKFQLGCFISWLIFAVPASLYPYLLSYNHFITHADFIFPSLPWEKLRLTGTPKKGGREREGAIP